MKRRAGVSVGRVILVAVVIAVTLGATRPRVAAVLVVTVGEVTSGAFIADAQVRLPSIGRSERTRWNGEAIFSDITDKRVRIQVRAIGYAPGDFETLITGDTTVVHFELEKVSSTLDTVRVRASRGERQLQEFEVRRHAGLGRFIVDSVIAAEQSKGLQQLLVSHVAGLKVAGRGVRAMEPQPAGKSMLRDGCKVLVYLDGFKLTEIDPRYDSFDLEPIDIANLAGIEAYNQPNAPVQYKPSIDYCKVILLWSKR